MTFDAAIASSVLEAILAATAITWSLQLQLIWRAYDTVRKPRVIGALLLLLLIVGFVSLALPIWALGLAAAGYANSGFFETLFWSSVSAASGFLVGLFAMYAVLTLVFQSRKVAN